MPRALADRFSAVLRARRRTVWDARGLLARFRDRLIALEVDDGQSPDVTLYGRYEDVVHAPELGFALVLRGLMASREDVIRRSHSMRRERTTVPVRLIRRLPEPFRFLKRLPGEWPMPPALVPCPEPACGYEANTGRFCVQCGAAVRTGWTQRFPGEGFAAMQAALRELIDEDPSAGASGPCGGVMHASFAACPKCGRDHVSERAAP